MADAGLAPQQLIERVQADVRDYVGHSLQDDVCLLALRASDMGTQE